MSSRLGSRSLDEVASSISSSDHQRTESLLAVLAAGLAAVEPENAVAKALAGAPIDTGGVTIVALGKSAPAMTRGAALAFGDDAVRGVAVSDHFEVIPPAIELVVTAHPYPDESSVAVGRHLLHLLAGLSAGATLLFLVSGGGSALVEVPADGLELDDLVDTWRLLSSAGVPIEEMNTVRTHLSAIKGGRLAAAAPVAATTVVISDVPSGRIDLVASGPTVPCTTTPHDALQVLHRHGLSERVPGRVVEVLSSGHKPAAPLPGRLVVAADGSTAAGAAADSAEEGVVLTTELGGIARESAIAALHATPPGAIGVFGGETTVEVTGDGRGGRNQEAALAAALAIAGSQVVFASLGTDGIDGPTDAAGAVVDGSTVGRIRRAGIDPEAALADNDSYTALDAGGALIRTGPTGTNVADIWLVDNRRDHLRSSGSG